MDLIRKLILRDYPNYDFTRYRFRFGDIIKFRESYLFALESSLTECKFLPLSKGFGFDKMQEVKISYTELPYYKKGEFESIKYRVKCSYEIGTFATTKEGDVLITEVTENHVIGLCINPESDYYGGRVYVL